MTTARRAPEVLRYAAFTHDPQGGNPAGVVLDAMGLSDAEMLAIAAEVGYSETAFVTAAGPETGELRVRYFSPLAEVPFCGHATIATAVAWAQRHGPGRLGLQTRSGLVEVRTSSGPQGPLATLTSVPPHVSPLDEADAEEILASLRWAPDELDPRLPSRVAYAGAHHPVIAAATRERLSRLDYDFERLGSLMAARDWTTVQLVWRESADTFHARDPFPPGGVVEDPATGAAAAAFGAYLRDLRLADPPAEITVHQGDDLGRPSLLTVAIPAGAHSGIDVTGGAVALGPGD